MAHDSEGCPCQGCPFAIDLDLGDVAIDLDLADFDFSLLDLGDVDIDWDLLDLGSIFEPGVCPCCGRPYDEKH